MRYYNYIYFVCRIEQYLEKTDKEEMFFDIALKYNVVKWIKW